MNGPPLAILWFVAEDDGGRRRSSPCRHTFFSREPYWEWAVMGWRAFELPP